MAVLGFPAAVFSSTLPVFVQLISWSVAFASLGASGTLSPRLGSRAARRLQRQALIDDLHFLDRDLTFFRVEPRRLDLHRHAALGDEPRVFARAVGRDDDHLEA